ncbi:MAG TPA: lytic transglycosylase domain-containing protein [Caulobacteraceae bacterium]|nr:lytic transglycosylase domain-containing protein [Caulobacteraceae bacterium]
MVAVCAAALNGVAIAQTAPAVDTPAASAATEADVSAALASPAAPISAADAAVLRRGVNAAKAGDIAGAEGAEAVLTHPIARKMMLWAIIDTMPDRLPFDQLDEARKDLAGWPHAAGRQLAAERQLEAANLGPQRTIDWFAGAQPQSAEGAMALAAAYQAAGRPADAQALIRRFWRDRSFEAGVQRTMLTRFGALLTPEDHIRRANLLLYGAQGPAAHDIIALLPPDQQALANARMALRANSGDADALYAAVPPALAHDPGLAVERARWLIQRGQPVQALPLLADFPADPGDEAAGRMWTIRRQLVNVALQSGDPQSAFRAVDQHGLGPGTDAADAEFLAGWIALTRLHDAKAADRHFARLETIGASPITQARANYWRGRALEAEGDSAAAHTEYALGGRYLTTFYGQLAAAKAGQTVLTLPADPQPTTADRARFQSRELIQAAQAAQSAGLANLFDLFVIASVEAMPNPEECALLVDMARAAGEQDLSMRVVRLAAQRGFVLPERGYPLRSPPPSASVEPAMVLGIVRQESGFDPRVRSGAGARGMMQLMPATAKVVARRSGMGFEVGRLDDADYNMQIGTTFLGSLVEEFDGSYLMAAAAYNAGPNRPAQWTAACGDPRASSTDPVDYIECIPIGETRNYVMRVLEGMEVYRARLAGGRAPLTLQADLKRGGLPGYGGAIQLASAAPTIDSLLEGSLGASADAEEAVVASTPVPNPPETAPLRKTEEPVDRASRRGKGRGAPAHARAKAHPAGHAGKARKKRK